MGIREALNKNSALTTAIAVVGMIAALGVVGWNLRPSAQSDALPRYFFTTDDSLVGDDAIEALFVADASNIPPFIHEGKPASRAHVYTFDSGRTKVIAYLERYNPAGKEKIEAAKAKLKPGDQALLGVIDSRQRNLQVKKPGPGPWVDVTDETKAGEIIAVVTPPGASEKNIEIVDP